MIEVTLSLSDNIKFLENIPQRLKRTVFGNKFGSVKQRSQKNSNLYYMIDTTFRNIKLFVLSFKNVGNDHKRDSSTNITCHQ